MQLASQDNDSYSARRQADPLPPSSAGGGCGGGGWGCADCSLRRHQLLQQLQRHVGGELDAVLVLLDLDGSGELAHGLGVGALRLRLDLGLDGLEELQQRVQRLGGAGGGGVRRGDLLDAQVQRAQAVTQAGDKGCVLGQRQFEAEAR